MLVVDVSLVGPSPRGLVLYVLPLRRPVPVEVEQHKEFRPSDARCFAFRVGIRPQPARKEGMHFFILSLAPIVFMPTLDGGLEFQSLVVRGVWVLVADAPIG